jgi:hypothetical protein
LPVRPLRLQQAFAGSLASHAIGVDNEPESGITM